MPTIESLPWSTPIPEERRRAQRYAFAADAQVSGPLGERIARVTELSIAGTYLAMPDPFPAGAQIVIKIRTRSAFFQCHARVAHTAPGLGMGVQFGHISPPFLQVLQGWLLAAIQEPSPARVS